MIPSSSSNIVPDGGWDRPKAALCEKGPYENKSLQYIILCVNNALKLFVCNVFWEIG